MLTKNQIKAVQRLHLKKYRQESQCYIIEGPKILEEAINANVEIKQIFATQRFLDEQRFLTKNISIHIISENELGKISLLTQPNMCVAIVGTNQNPNLKTFSADSLILYLDEIKDPGNLGTIIRIANWFGINNIAVSPNCVEIYNPKVVQSTMGAIFHLNIIEISLQNLLNQLDANVEVYGTLLNGDNIYQSTLSQKGIIIIGNESTGISAETQKYITKPLYIPSYKNNSNDNTVESLNAAVATAIVCSEFRRRKF